MRIRDILTIDKYFAPAAPHPYTTGIPALLYNGCA